MNDYIASLASSLTAPIFQGGRLHQEVRIQTSEAEETAAAFALTTLNAMADVENALALEAGVELQIDLLEATVRSAELANRLAQVRYRAGLVTLLKVLETQRSLNTAKLKLILAEQALLEAKIDLYLSLGGDWMPRIVDEPLDGTRS